MNTSDSTKYTGVSCTKERTSKIKKNMLFPLTWQLNVKLSYTRTTRGF